MDLLTENTQEIAHYKKQVEQLKKHTQFILKHFKPVLNREIYLSGKEVCDLLHITTRTLQQYRDDKLLPYIQFGGKILYKESDIIKILENNYSKKED